jgi:hypothetical protein
VLMLILILFFNVAIVAFSETFTCSLQMINGLFSCTLVANKLAVEVTQKVWYVWLYLCRLYVYVYCL